MEASGSVCRTFLCASFSHFWATLKSAVPEANCAGVPAFAVADFLLSLYNCCKAVFRASVNRRVSYVSSDDTKAVLSYCELLSAKSCQPIDGASGGYIINCATVDPDNVIVESSESNNTDCVTTQFVP